MNNEQYYYLWDVWFPEIWNYIGLTTRIYAYTIIDCTLTELTPCSYGMQTEQLIHTTTHWSIRILHNCKRQWHTAKLNVSAVAGCSIVVWRSIRKRQFQDISEPAKPTHSHAVYIPTHLPQSHNFHSHWIDLPRTLLKVTSQIVWHIHAMAFKAAWWVMQALEFWADTKSCRDLSHLFRVDLSRLPGEKKTGA